MFFFTANFEKNNSIVIPKSFSFGNFRNGLTGLFRASAPARDRPNACEGASGCRQTAINDTEAQMFFDMSKGQITTPGTPCPTLYE